MAEALGDRLVTTTVGFAEAAHNELAAARLTAAHVKALHHEHLIEPSLDEVLDPATIGCGEPMADSSAIPTWYVSRAARSHVTVALSGDGGDETFAGYDFRYVPHVLESQARRLLPGAAGRRLARWTGRAWPRGQHVPKALRAGTLLDNLSRDAASAFYVDLCFLKPAPTRALMGLDAGDERDSAAYAAVTDVYRRCPSSCAADARAVHGPARLHAERPAGESGSHEHEARAGSAQPLSRSPRRRAGLRMPPRPSPARQDRQVDPARAGEAAAAGRHWPPMPKRGFTAPVGRLDRRPLCRPLRGRGAGVVDAHRRPASIARSCAVGSTSIEPAAPTTVTCSGPPGCSSAGCGTSARQTRRRRCGGDAVIPVVGRGYVRLASGSAGRSA